MWKNSNKIVLICSILLVIYACKEKGEINTGVVNNPKETAENYEFENYNIVYDNDCSKFEIYDDSRTLISSIDCPQFWNYDEEYDNIHPNILYDDKSKTLELFIYDDSKGKLVSFYFIIDRNELLPLYQPEYYDYYRDFPYYGKRIDLDDEITNDFFSEMTASVLNRCDSDSYILLYKDTDCQNLNNIIEVYYNSTNEKYYVFCADNRRSFFYSICLLEKAEKKYVIGDPFLFESTEGTTGKEIVSGWKEEIVYSDDKVLSYKSSGICDESVAILPAYNNGEQVELLSFEYVYSENGDLIQWTKTQNYVLWGMNQSIREYFCDHLGRCNKARYELTSGEEEVYYIYDNNDTPEYLVVYNGFNNFLRVYKYD